MIDVQYKRLKAPALFAAAAFALLLLCAVAIIAGAKPAQAVGPVQWAPCQGAPTTPARECAVLQVPKDYNNPAAGTADLHIARVKASNPANYKGALLVLPGGPPSAGVSFVGYSANLDRSVAPAVQQSYDLIGIEQFGSWNGVPCLSGQALQQYWETNHLPKSPTQLHNVMSLEKQFNDGCTNPQNDLVPYMNTQRSIRDMETVRQALSVNKINMLSFSYGTALAHGYMAAYPSKVGRTVLDSVVDRSVPDPRRDEENNVGYEQSWTLFKNWCRTTTDCALHGQNLEQTFTNAINTAKTTGIPTTRNPYSPNGSLNDWELTVATQALTGAGEATWIWASVLLKDAAQGDGSQAALLYDLLSGRQPDGSYFGGDGTRRSYSCNDTTWSQRFQIPENVQQWAQHMQIVAPHYGAASVYQGVAQCYKWAFPPVSPQPLVENVPAGVGALLVNAQNDASAPLAWAQRVQTQIPGSKLVKVNGASHLQLAKSRCAMGHAATYLLTGVTPANNTVCSYDADLIPPQLPPDLGPLPMSTQATNLPTISPQILEQLRQQF